MDDKTIQVLLIEDNPGDVRLIREMLRGVNGYRFEIHHADRLQTGLEMLSPEASQHSAKPQMDVVVLDLTLPDSSGYETFTRLHQYPCNLPIVLLTGLDDEELGVHAIADGAQDYLVKNKLDDELLARALRYAVERKRAADALRQSEQLFKKMYSGLRDAVLFFDADTRLIFDCNPAAILTFGVRRDEIIQKKLDVLFTNSRLGELCLGRLNRKGTQDLVGPLFEAEMQRKDGSSFFAEYSLVPLENDSTRVVRWVMIVRDITARKHAEETLRISQERYMLAMQGANDGLWDWNLEINEVHYSPRWKAMLGYLVSEIGSSPEEWLDRVHTHDRSRLDIAIDAHLKGASPHLMIEYRILHKDGTYRWMLCRGLAVRNGQEKAYRMAGSQTDVTDRKKAEEQLLYDAFHDNLTGIANRALFLDRLGRVIEHAKRRDNYQFAVLFLDLDRFKVINDSLGHIVGDQLLKLTAERLESVLRSGDTIARFGGDEFVILLEDIQSKEDAIQVAERVQRKLEDAYLVHEQKVFTSASIGIVLSSIGYETTNEVVRDADIAMYQAKLMGKARYCVFNIEMREKAIARMELENDLHHALERGELFLDYQPYISMANQRIVGFEALVRWHHPRRGVIPPAEFIPIAEETGLIYRIGYWILKQACKQMASWHHRFPADPPLKINVNISSKQFSKARLWDDIREILEETRLDPGALALEITENMLMENDDHVDEILGKLRAIGVKLQIDDFGTGYSSLGYLQRFPIHTLKIDSTFIHSLDIGSDQSNIVKTILSLATEMGIDTIAEGVETSNQLSILREMHCPFVQGFLISKPVDHQQAYYLLESQNGHRSAIHIQQTKLADSAS